MYTRAIHRNSERAEAVRKLHEKEVLPIMLRIPGCLGSKVHVEGTELVWLQQFADGATAAQSLGSPEYLAAERIMGLE